MNMTPRRTLYTRLCCAGASILLLALLGTVLAGTSYAQDSTSETIAKRRAELEAQLAHLEQLMEEQQRLLQSKQGERVSLERDLKIIEAEIKKARIGIQARELVIAKLEDEIFDTEVTILELSEKLERERESLSELVRKTAEADERSLVELVLSNKSFSEFFAEVDDMRALKEALKISHDEIENLRNKNSEVKGSLVQKQMSEIEMKTLQALQKQKLDQQEAHQSTILKNTKGEESRYQAMLKSTERSAAQIRAELFELRGSAAINLGDAIEFANFASTKTGVRSAFILGVLKQETRLGEFLGNGTWSEDMHPTRDRPVFQAITSALGMDPNRMPVSKAPGYGWGGAMGPAQFIPSTWACYGGYVNANTGTCSNQSGMSTEAFWAGPWRYEAGSDRLRVLRGKSSPSNPWDNQDAFLATALYMSELGASGGDPAAERKAALRYFAGGNWSNPAYAFYGDGVMEHATYFQTQIDALKRLSQ